MLWFQVEHIGMVPTHFDVLFSIWRLAWFAHQIVRAPTDLFNANIFYPEPRTLAFSDAIPFESALAAPLLWSHVDPAVTYNLLILASFVAAGCSMFLLVRSETGSDAAGWCSGLIFAFAPFRFQHYIHLELLWTAPIPLAFWAFRRTMRHGRLRDGVLTGVFVAVQMLAAIYYGIFLIQSLAVATVGHMAAKRLTINRRTILALFAGAIVALTIVVPYGVPYRE